VPVRLSAPVAISKAWAIETAELRYRSNKWRRICAKRQPNLTGALVDCGNRLFRRCQARWPVRVWRSRSACDIRIADVRVHYDWFLRIGLSGDYGIRGCSPGGRCVPRTELMLSPIASMRWPPTDWMFIMSSMTPHSGYAFDAARRLARQPARHLAS